jgi:hypothetical protein
LVLFVQDNDGNRSFFFQIPVHFKGISFSGYGKPRVLITSCCQFGIKWGSKGSKLRAFPLGTKKYEVQAATKDRFSLNFTQLMPTFFFHEAIIVWLYHIHTLGNLLEAGNYHVIVDELHKPRSQDRTVAVVTPPASPQHEPHHAATEAVAHALTLTACTTRYGRAVKSTVLPGFVPELTSSSRISYDASRFTPFPPNSPAYNWLFHNPFEYALLMSFWIVYLYQMAYDEVLTMSPEDPSSGKLKNKMLHCNFYLQVSLWIEHPLYRQMFTEFHVLTGF